MNRRSTLLRTLVFTIAGLVMLTSVVGQTADESAKTIYHPDPDHLWNQLHQVVFVRVDESGNEYGRDVVDPMLWDKTWKFLLQGKSHQNAVGLLEQFVTEDGASLIQDPLRRAVLQHDLWAVFDWAATVEKPSWFMQEHLSPYQKAKNDRYLGARRLADRLAPAIAQLALDDKTIASLPNNYDLAVASKSFATEYEENSNRSLLPAELLDPEGPWVCIRGAADSPSAPVHMERFGGRSPFLVFLNVPGGRQVALDYIKRLNEYSAGAPQEKYAWEKNVPLFPVGTAVALVRRMNIINRKGELMTTPLVQTVQLRVYLRVSNRRSKADRTGSLAVYKSTLNRRNLFANKAGGLVPVTPETKAVIKLEDHIRHQNKSDYLDQGRPPSMHNVLRSCVNCHMGCGGGPNAKSIFTFNQVHWASEIPGAANLSYNDLRLLPTDIETEQNRAMRWKSQREEWHQLHGFLNEGTKRTEKGLD